MINRRKFLACLSGLLGMSLHATAGITDKFSISSIPMSAHETAMRKAIEVAKLNPAYPFGAVITHAASGRIVAIGVNTSSANPMFHGEIVCMNNYIKSLGNANWSDHILYTTGEPCPMCMSALTWAGVMGVVYGSSIETISRSGIEQINISAQTIAKAADFKQPELLGGILEDFCDELFSKRQL